MTFELIAKIFDLKSKTTEQAAQDMMEWASHTLNQAHELHQAGFITGQARSAAEQNAAEVQKYAYALRGVSYL